MKVYLEEIMFTPAVGRDHPKEIVLKRYRPFDTKGKKLPEAWHLVCPRCQKSGLIDEDQYFGRVSIQCDCGFHETINFRKEITETV